MARIAGINIPMNKHVVIGLTHIFGIGNSRAARICDAAGVKYNVKVKDLTDAEVAHARVFPCRSVIVMMVLVNEACTCAIASSTFLRAFFGFLAAAAAAAVACWGFCSAIC